MLFIFPVSSMMANEIKNYTVEEAVNGIKENDITTKITAAKPKLSDETKPYQGKFSDELEVIQDKQVEYQDLITKLQSEMTAYQVLYNYWLAEESLKLQEKNVAQTENELEVVKKKLGEGVASELDRLNAEISLNNAKASYEETLQGANQAKYQLNQSLGNDFNEEIALQTTIKDPVFQYVPKYMYETSEILPNVLKDHPSLSVVQTTVTQYEEIVDDSDNLSVLGGSTYKDNIEGLEEQIDNTQSQLIILEYKKAQGTITPAEEATLAQLPGTLISLINQLDNLEDDYDDAQDDRNQAEDELKEYYEEELAETKLQLEQKQQQLELIVYNYEERFDRSREKISLYSENVQKTYTLYDKYYKMFEQGMMTSTELEKIRMNLLNTNLQLQAAKKDYILLQKEFELFKQGYLPKGF